MPNDKRSFPGGSRERVTRAGNNVRMGRATEDDLAAINNWRAAHRHVINSFQAILRQRTRGSRIVVGQRHKRRHTIFDKLQRLPQMQLGRMDDVAGCRLIFPTIAELHQFRNTFHERSRFSHRLKNEKDKYDYIARPKSTGYRGIHDVYTYDVNSTSNKHLKGLLIELQYRTIHQHAWATANELIGSLTASQPKFERGDPRYQRIMQLTSEIIARSYENMNSCLSEFTGDQLVSEFLDLDSEIHLMHMLRGLNVADQVIANKKNFILIYGEDGKVDEPLDIRPFKNATDAMRALFVLEREHPGKDIVLVRGDDPEAVRESFKNYFSDAKEFVNLIDKGCEMLLPDRVVTVPI